MKQSKYCARHKRRHSLHAQLHCGALKPGECLNKKGEPRGDKCPVKRVQ